MNCSGAARSSSTPAGPTSSTPAISRRAQHARRSPGGRNSRRLGAQPATAARDRRGRRHPRLGRWLSALQAVGFSRSPATRWSTSTPGDGQGWPWPRRAWDLDRLARALRDDSVELVDVRELEEWAAGHVAGSQHLPLHRLQTSTRWRFPTDGRTIAVACAAGNRAAFAASMLRGAGHRDVVRIADGGVPDLRERGIELEQGLAGAQLPSHATS